LIHFIPTDSQLGFALEPFLYPQNVILYDKYIEQVIIDLELVRATGTRLQENPQLILHLVVMIQLTSRRILRD